MGKMEFVRAGKKACRMSHEAVVKKLEQSVLNRNPPAWP